MHVGGDKPIINSCDACTPAWWLFLKDKSKVWSDV